MKQVKVERTTFIRNFEPFTFELPSQYISPEINLSLITIYRQVLLLWTTNHGTAFDCGLFHEEGSRAFQTTYRRKDKPNVQKGYLFPPRPLVVVGFECQEECQDPTTN